MQTEAEKSKKMQEKFMKMALTQAKKAFLCDEVPIGAIIEKDGQVVSRAFNTRNKSRLATAHAEVIALQKACKKLGDWRLNGCKLYVTLEPCLMCLGACFNARIDEVIFGAFDQNSGGIAMLLNPTAQNTLNHTMTTTGGVLEKKCSQLLTEYFKNKRK